MCLQPLLKREQSLGSHHGLLRFKWKMIQSDLQITWSLGKYYRCLNTHKQNSKENSGCHLSRRFSDKKVSKCYLIVKQLANCKSNLVWIFYKDRNRNNLEANICVITWVPKMFNVSTQKRKSFTVYKKIKDLSQVNW